METDELSMKDWMVTLGIESRTQWDVLLFLYRHHVGLLGAEYIGHLLGYPMETAMAALDVLEPLGLVQRSRVSQNVRLYQFTEPTDPSRRDALKRLIALAETRAGRLQLFESLGSAKQRAKKQLASSRQRVNQTRKTVQSTNRRLASSEHRLRLPKGRCESPTIPRSPDDTQD